MSYQKSVAVTLDGDDIVVKAVHKKYPSVSVILPTGIVGTSFALPPAVAERLAKALQEAVADIRESN